MGCTFCSRWRRLMLALFGIAGASVNAPSHKCLYRKAAR